MVCKSPQTPFWRHVSRPFLLIMRNPDCACANKFPNDRVTRNNSVVGGLFQSKAFDALNQPFNMVVTDPCIQKTGIGFKILRLRQQSVWAAEIGFEHGQIE